MTKTLMIQGTASGVGKSLLVAAMCRIFRDMGLSVAPFKSQNMALNSYVTADGGEIGRAQALQAEAARLKPTVDMNPILLKASGEMGAQVIIQGRLHSNMPAREYYAFRDTAWKAVKASFDKLARQHELIVIEGAGSPAEINLSQVEIVNMAVARYAKAPVILAGDIDRGGVFASLYGTVKLLGRDSRYIKGYIINKFRGDMSILEPGLASIRQMTGRPVIGVLPYVRDIGLPEEDGLGLYHKSPSPRPSPPKGEGEINTLSPGGEGRVRGIIRVVILRLPYMANFTDFDPFQYEPDVEMLYSLNPADIENADLVIVPGSKNTVKDLLYLRENRLDESLKRACAKGVMLAGICGGYQMLGRKIFDPHGMESPHPATDGIGLLNIETALEKVKTTCQVEAQAVPGGLPFAAGVPLTGYEIHLGTSRGDIGLFELKRLSPDSEPVMDGSVNGKCWGTYLHGIFENDAFRRGLIDYIRQGRGMLPLSGTVSYSGMKDQAIDNLANLVREHVDMDYVKSLCRLK